MADEENAAITTDQTAAAASEDQNNQTTQKQHPLENSWTFWFDSGFNKSKQAEWGSAIRPIYTFSTVEEFWRFMSLKF